MTQLITRRGVLAGGALLALANCAILKRPHSPSAKASAIETLPRATAPDHPHAREILLRDFDEHTW
jgi:hypothetical protein